MDTGNNMLDMFRGTNMSLLLQDKRIQQMLPSILSEELKLPEVLASVMYGGDRSTARSDYSFDDAFSVFAFLA